MCYFNIKLTYIYTKEKMERKVSYRPTVTSVFTQASTLIARTGRQWAYTHNMLSIVSTTEVIGPTPDQCWLIFCDVSPASA